MSVRVNHDFYLDQIPDEYTCESTSISRDIREFFSDSYHITRVVNYKHLFWTIHFKDPKQELLFRLKYSEYIQ